MVDEFHPAIVVAAYQRPHSLKRILGSLNNAKFNENVTLIISIDNDEPNNLEVRNIAEQFNWSNGLKEVHYQEKHLGLRQHILQCGDLSMKYGSVIILEDDLYVSPYFYDYAVQALKFYYTDDSIGGISLYNQPLQEIAQYPFTAIQDNSDVYFIQFPSSWGQAWTRTQWKRFREWYASEPDLSLIDIPMYILNWPERSWKKYFSAYLVEKNKFFVFPRLSFTTNFNDIGTHYKKHNNYQGQTPLRLFGRPYRFRRKADSLCIYDVYLELLSDCIFSLSSHLDEYSFELDLYGTKDLEKIKKPYLITSRPSVRPIQGFKRALKPHDLNIILNLEGKDFVLSEVKYVFPFINRYERIISNYKYFYAGDILGWKTQIYYYNTRIKNKIFKPDRKPHR
ncbi:MAG: hypothetical protein JXB49_32590 [Bacteroidales bacterium]|nr:hypothetical protein [Bacteroidales bacterium]